MLNNFSLGLQKYKEKIDAGTMTKEDVANLKIIINKYLAFKKEVVVAIHTLQNINTLMEQCIPVLLSEQRSVEESELLFADGYLMQVDL